MSIFNISVSSPYLKTLARFLFERFSPGEFENAIVLLPSRRAVRFLQEELVSASASNLILPQISPIGDIESDNFVHAENDIAEANLVGKLEQKLKLTELINTHQAMSYNLVQSAGLAEKLINLLNEFGDYELDINCLSQYLEVDESKHMQLILKFLLDINDSFAARLKLDNKQDFSSYRRRIIDGFNESLKTKSISSPVIIAGSFGEFPAVLRLIQTISHLDSGYVVLPKSEFPEDKSSLEACEASHPLYYISTILDACNASSAEVEQLDYYPKHKNFSVNSNKLDNPVKADAKESDIYRKKLISNFYLMRSFEPEELNNCPVYVKGIEYLTAENPINEAAIIALKTKHRLSYSSNSKIGIITEDEKFITLLNAYMKRLNIEMDDGLGISASQTQTFSFIISAAEMVINDFTPLKLLSLLKHPFINNSFAAEIEMQLFRDYNNSYSPENLLKTVSEKSSGELYLWLEQIIGFCRNFREAIDAEHVNFDKLFRMHIDFVEKLYPAIWESEEGGFIRGILYELSKNSNNISNLVAITQYISFLESMLAGYKYRQKSGWSPSVSIISPEESRSLDFDCVIIPDFNESTWPSLSSPDSLMNKRMRDEIGLPSHKAGLCFNFYNFLSNLSNSEIFITRALKKNGTETSPSRYLALLQKIMPGLNLEELLAPKLDFRALSQKLARGDYFKENPQSVQSAVITGSEMPKYLSATSVQNLIVNPYGFYAEKILGLSKLNELEEEPGMAEFGNFIHEVIEKYTLQAPDKSDYELFVKLGRQVLDSLAYSKFINNLWWPKFLKIASEFVDYHHMRRKKIKQVIPEIRGKAELNVSGESYFLTAIADRIEVNQENTINILDYKTGYVPSKKEVKLGLAPQLLIEALIASKGGFKELLNTQGLSHNLIEQLIYVKISPSEPVCFESHSPYSSELLENTEEFIHNLIEYYAVLKKEFKSAPLKNHPPRFNDYAHLAREQE